MLGLVLIFPSLIYQKTCWGTCRYKDDEGCSFLRNEKKRENVKDIDGSMYPVEYSIQTSHYSQQKPANCTSHAIKRPHEQISRFQNTVLRFPITTTQNHSGIIG